MNTRRNFLFGSLAFAGMPAAFAAAPALKVSPIRGGGADEVLRIHGIELPVGATKPFRALHFSDTHLNFWDVTDFFGNRQREEHFERRWVRFPQALNSFYATLDYAERNHLPMLHTGDLLDWNTAANVNFLRRNLKGLDFLYSLGNHEYHSSDGRTPALTHAAARERLQGVIANDLTVASKVMNGVDFVAFDDGEGNLRPETIAAVELEFGKGLPVVLMCHIPPIYTEKFLDNSLESSRAILRGQGLVAEAEACRRGRFRTIEERFDGPTAAFWRRMQERTQLKAILCGHTHVQERDRFSETADMLVTGGNYEGVVTEFTFV